MILHHIEEVGHGTRHRSRSIRLLPALGGLPGNKKCPSCSPRHPLCCLLPHYHGVTGDLHNIDTPSRQCRGRISGELPGELFQ
jgi:hypothetical protein